MSWVSEWPRWDEEVWLVRVLRVRVSDPDLETWVVDSRKSWDIYPRDLRRKQKLLVKSTKTLEHHICAVILPGGFHFGVLPPAGFGDRAGMRGADFVPAGFLTGVMEVAVK